MVDCTLQKRGQMKEVEDIEIETVQNESGKKRMKNKASVS
jgi:hypothetical protein